MAPDRPVTTVPADLALPPRTLDRFRSAMKFSLWTWALYWPGGGLLLMVGGLDPVSIIVTLLSLAAFFLMLATGALRADSSRTIKEFMLERPLYLVVALAAFVALAAVVPNIESFALLLFATAWFGGLGLTALRLVEHVRTEGLSFWKSKADQMLVVFGMAGFFSSLVFLDALLPLIANGATLGSPSELVAVANWMNLLFPGFILLASRPFREPLRWPTRAERAERADQAAQAARRRKAAKEPTPFRAS